MKVELEGDEIAITGKRAEFMKITCRPKFVDGFEKSEANGVEIQSLREDETL
jgi:hypothetical protein